LPAIELVEFAEELGGEEAHACFLAQMCGGSNRVGGALFVDHLIFSDATTNQARVLTSSGGLHDPVIAVVEFNEVLSVKGKTKRGSSIKNDMKNVLESLTFGVVLEVLEEAVFPSGKIGRRGLIATLEAVGSQRV
jgi:hypothetical protein